MTVDSPSDDSEVSSTQDVDPYDANLSRTFVPLTPPRMTEQEAIRQSVQEQQSNLPSTVAWPPAGETPINEFRTEGYIFCAFPTLFPTVAADFVAPRACAVIIGNNFKHLLMYEDGRFARHPCFCYLLSTPRCDGVLFRQARFMFDSALKMPSSQWKSSVTWLVVKEKPFQTVCCTMLAAYEGQGSTGSSSGVSSLPW